MALNKTKLAEGGEVGEILAKKTLFLKFKKLSLVKKLIIVAILLIIVVFSFYGYSLFVGKKIAENTKPIAMSVCSKDEKLITEVAKARDTNDIKYLAKLSEQIQAIPNYNSDPNCIYALLQYSLAVGDSKKSRQQYNEYAKLYTVSSDKYRQTGNNLPGEDLSERVKIIEESYNMQIQNAKARGQNVSE